MGLCFRKSISIFPGLKLNLSKSGVSITGGVKGLHKTVNLGTGKTTTTVGVPGTGVYYRTASSLIKGKGKGKDKDSKDSKTSSKGNSSEQENASNSQELQDYNLYVESLKSIHKNSDGSIDWNNIDSSNKELKGFADRVSSGDIDSYLEVIDEVKPFDDLLQYGSGFEVGTDRSDALEVEFAVKSDEVIPQEAVVESSSGTISRKELTKTAYFDLLQDYVSSTVIRVARDCIALLPVDTVLVTAVDKVLNTATGNDEEVAILSVKITREQLEVINFDRIDPSDALTAFGAEFKFKKTEGFSPIQRLSL